MFIDYCNGGDLKSFMEIRQYSIHPDVIQKIMKQIVNAFSDMIFNLIIHRDYNL